MTLIGARFLECVSGGGLQIVLRRPESGMAVERAVIETYPGAVARAVGFEGSYKQKPADCLEAAERYLLAHKINLDFDTEVRRFCLEYRTRGNDPDGADAFLCLVTAISFREGLSEWHGGSGNLEQLNEEGSIVTPRRIVANQRSSEI
jgi:hypothetical protein